MKLLMLLSVLALIGVTTVSATRGALFRSRRAEPVAWSGREDFLRFGRANPTESSDNRRIEEQIEDRGKRFFTDFYGVQEESPNDSAY